MRKILIIDDDPIIRLGISQFLTSQGYSVSSCADGNEGITAIENGLFDLIITDLKLPHHDGFEMLKKAKTISPKTGVIIITGHTDVDRALYVLKEGAFDYIVKPFSHEDLFVAVNVFFKFRDIEKQVENLRETIKGTCSSEGHY